MTTFGEVKDKLLSNPWEMISEYKGLGKREWLNYVEGLRNEYTILEPANIHTLIEEKGSIKLLEGLELEGTIEKAVNHKYHEDKEINDGFDIRNITGDDKTTLRIQRNNSMKPLIIRLNGNYEIDTGDHIKTDVTIERIIPEPKMPNIKEEVGSLLRSGIITEPYFIREITGKITGENTNLSIDEKTYSGRAPNFY